MNQPNSTLLDWALQYAQMGWPVLPVRTGRNEKNENNKAPVTELVGNGKNNATTDQATLERWFKGKAHNLAITPPENVLVLDFDEEQARQMFFNTWPELGEYPAQKTPGGVHVFMRVPLGTRLTSKVKLAKGLDLRGLGTTYLVATPSQYDGQGYEWVVPLVPVEDLPMVPASLLEHLQKAAGNYGQMLVPISKEEIARRTATQVSTPRLEGLLHKFADNVATTPEGGRHGALINNGLSAAGLIAHGMPESRVWDTMYQAGLACGLPQFEAWSAVSWAVLKGRDRPLKIDPDPMGFDPDWWKPRRQRQAPAVVGEVIKYPEPIKLGAIGNTAPETEPTGKGKVSALNLMKARVRAGAWGQVVTDIYRNEEDRLIYLSTEMGDFPILWESPLNGALIARFVRILDPAGMQQKTVGEAVTEVARALLDMDVPTYRLRRRIAPLGRAVYLDTAGNGIVEITPGGWRVIEDWELPEGVKFSRDDVEKMPRPEFAGGVEEAKSTFTRLFKEYVQVGEEEQALIILAMFSWYTPDNPQFWLNFVGRKGSGKSSAAEWVLNFVNPTGRHTVKDNEDDLKKYKAQQWCILVDNLVHATMALANTIDVAATGGIYTYRAAYSRDTMVHARIDGGGIVTSLSPIFSKLDTLDRVFTVEFEPRAKGKKRDDDEIKAAFKEDFPKMWGAFLTLVAEAMRLHAEGGWVDSGDLKEVRNTKAERFFRLVFPERARVLDRAIDDVREGAVHSARQGETLTTTIPLVYAAQLANPGYFEAPADEILLTIRSSQVWGPYARTTPETGAVLGARLRENADAFLAIGIKVTGGRTKKTRFWRLEVVDKELFDSHMASLGNAKNY